jgi:hypothetical protein
VKYNIKNHKIIIFVSIIITIIILLNPSITAIEYNQVENAINIEDYKIIIKNQFIIEIIDMIIKILELIFIIPLFYVEEIIDIIWELISQIEDPYIKAICTLYNLIIEIYWYICFGLCYPIFIIVHILTLIRDALEPNNINNLTNFYSLSPKN